MDLTYAISFVLLSTTAWACAAAPKETGVDPSASVPIDHAVENFNYVLGTQTFGIRYTFTEEDGLVETAKAIHGMGSNVLKIGLGDRYHGEWYGLPKDDSIRTVGDLVRTQPSYRRVLNMPFKYYFFWVYPMSTEGSWADGLSESEEKQEYREMFDLARHLLKTYSGTGKTFYLGHWEGDWHLHPDYDGSKDPSDTMLKGMADWLNVRQRAIDDAKAKTKHHDVQVYHYTEVCLVDKAMNGGKTLTNDVLPRTNVDYVSWSCYDRLNWGGKDLDVGDIEDRMVPALEYIESKLSDKPGIPGKRVFIGEYGFPLRIMETPEQQDRYSREVARVCLTWGCPFVLYWEMYCNENKDGQHKGFWLIDEHGVKQPIYDTHKRYYQRAKGYVRSFLTEHGRVPTPEEYRKVAPSFLSPE